MALTGASADLARSAAALRAAGNGGARLAMLRGLKTGAAPLIPAVKEAARYQLPKRGGLNEQVAGQDVKVQVRTGARTAGVRLVTTAPDTRQTDRGWVRHPSPRNNRKKWVYQSIPFAAGWWTQTLTDKSPEVSVEITRVLTELSFKIQRGL